MNIEALQARDQVSSAMQMIAMAAIDGAHQVQNATENQANTVRSEDSNLAGALSSYGSTVEMIGQAIQNLMDELNMRWEQWVTETVANEQETAAEVISIQSEITDIASNIQSIIGN